MTDEMAERTLVSVAAVREVVGEEILLARRRAEKAADIGHAERVVAWLNAADRLIVVCERLGVGEPVLCGGDGIEWED